MDEIRCRYEFRVWGDKLTQVRERLELLASPRVTESAETYLVSAATDKCNVKIRAGLLDIKVLVAIDRGLEQWKPIMKEGFPLDSAIIASQIFPPLQLARPALAKTSYELQAFLDDVVRPHPDLTIVDVRKTRYMFGIGDCSAEYAQTTINGVPRDTAAVESLDPDAVLHLVREINVSGANTSYIVEAKRVLGDVSPTSR